MDAKLLEKKLNHLAKKLAAIQADVKENRKNIQKLNETNPKESKTGEEKKKSGPNSSDKPNKSPNSSDKPNKSHNSSDKPIKLHNSSDKPIKSHTNKAFTDKPTITKVLPFNADEDVKPPPPKPKATFKKLGANVITDNAKKKDNSAPTPRIIQVASKDSDSDDTSPRRRSHSHVQIERDSPDINQKLSKMTDVVDKAMKDSNEEMEEKIAEERQSYAEGLSIHGLSRIATGGPASRVLWIILVVGSLTTAILITKEHWDAYLSHNSVTNTRIEAAHDIEFPSITICNYAGINVERRHFSGNPPTYIRPRVVEESSMRNCGHNLTSCNYQQAALLKVQNYSADYAHSALQNDLVKFDDTTNCFTVGGYLQAAPSDIFSVQLVANRTGDLWSELYINPTSETFHEASPTIYWASEGFYHVNVVKKIITRLGLPYTECIKGSGTYAQNKFTGIYTVTKCKKGCFWEVVFEKCGAIPPMYKKHMREPYRFDNTSFVSDADGQACLREVENDDSVTEKCNGQCKLQPCYEEDIKMSLDFHRSPNPNFLEFAFTFKSFLVEVVEEAPAYTWQDLFANFGGCVGLMTGASILSFVELFIFLGLILMDKFDLYSKVSTKVVPTSD
ncbi:acid-sensing ion channel 2-like [Clytia hemisphaerica]|uniref:acid-sensing ion channel 2-like n=1 Tax=Clytia hemisphaerica TaxID=252671 RepID=UPI0034D4846C